MWCGYSRELLDEPIALKHEHSRECPSLKLMCGDHREDGGGEDNETYPSRGNPYVTQIKANSKDYTN